MKKRILSMVMATVMLLTGVPVTNTTADEPEPVAIVVGHINAGPGSPFAVTEYNVRDALVAAGITKEEPFTVTFEEGVTEIYSVAFRNCTGMVSVTIPDTVTLISQYAFENCTGLTEINFPDSVTDIRYDAFKDCTGLTEVTIPDNVKILGEIYTNRVQGSTFQGCTSLRTVTIGSGLETIGENMFYGCAALTSINVSPENANFVSENGVLFNKDKTKIITYPAAKTETSYSIPDGVESIEPSAFMKSANLATVTIPDSVTFIGQEAFRECGLTSVTIPANAKFREAFRGFGGSFRDCKQLMFATFEAEIPPLPYGDDVTGDYIEIFYGCDNMTTVYVPQGRKAIYQMVREVNKFSLNVVEIGGNPEPCSVCGVLNCGKTHVYCNTCKKYDCGIDHNTKPQDPDKVTIGDIDGDGKTTISDALEILKFLAGMGSKVEKGSPAFTAADIDGDGKVTIQDALEVLKKLAGMTNKIDNP